MSASTAKTIFQHEVVVSDATTGEQAGLVIGTGTQLGTSSVPAAGLIGYDVATNAHVAGVYSDSATVKVARAVAVPIASGIITITGATSADVTIPDLDLATCRMTSSLAATAGAAAAATAPVFTKPAATTLRCTVTSPGAGQSVYVSYEIYAAPTP